MYWLSRSYLLLIVLYINPYLATLFQPGTLTSNSRVLSQHLIIKPESAESSFIVGQGGGALTRLDGIPLIYESPQNM